MSIRHSLPLGTQASLSASDRRHPAGRLLRVWPALIFCLLAPSAAAQEPAVPPATASQPPQAPALPHYEVLSRQVERVMAVEPAPLSGMTPVRKEITITVEQVADPHLPQPVPPPAVAPDPEKLAAFRARLAARPKPFFIQLSATVYDRKNTLLRWHPNGWPGPEMTAWSNLDFNLLAGQSRFTYAGRDYYLFMGLGYESTAARQRFALRRGIPYVPPVVPELPPVSTPAFVVTQGDATDAVALAPITALHELFKTDGPRLIAEYEARVQAQQEHETWLRAHPPEPRDVTLHYWRGTRTDNTNQGGNP